jgi:hypothetical protein
MLREAFKSGRFQESPPNARHSEEAASEDGFETGACWVRQVLEPTIERANSELKPEEVEVRLDLNLDPRSTNHAHADFWFSELREGHRRMGPKYSLNVRGQEVWLFKAGQPGRVLGYIKNCHAAFIEGLLRESAKEFGAQLR